MSVPFCRLGLMAVQQGLPVPLVAGLALVGCFALLLASGYVTLGLIYARRYMHRHR